MSNLTNPCTLEKFMLRVLSVTSDNCGDIIWNTDGKYAPLAFFVICNDLFYWGCADSEAVSCDNITILEQSYKDSPNNGGLLFCCRVRKMRPQGAYYHYFDADERPLFDACGQEREVCLGNPKSQHHAT